MRYQNEYFLGINSSSPSLCDVCRYDGIGGVEMTYYFWLGKEAEAYEA